MRWRWRQWMVGPDVARYVAGWSGEVRGALQGLMDGFFGAVPGSEMKVSCGVLGITFPGGGRIHLGGRKAGTSVYLGALAPALAEEFEVLGAGVKVVRAGTVHVPLGTVLPKALIQRIAQTAEDAHLQTTSKGRGKREGKRDRAGGTSAKHEVPAARRPRRK